MLVSILIIPIKIEVQVVTFGFRFFW